MKLLLILLTSILILAYLLITHSINSIVIMGFVICLWYRILDLTLTSLHDDSGVSSFNQLIHKLSVDSDCSSVDYSSGEDDDGYESPASPRSRSSYASWASTVWEYDKHQTTFEYILSWILCPFKFLFGLPIRFFHLLFLRGNLSSQSPHTSYLHSPRKLPSLRDHFVHCATDRRRGVIEVSIVNFL